MINRIKELQNILNDNTGALILSAPNRFYLTGFDTSDGAVVVTKNNAVFLTDFRYIEKARQVVKHIDCQLLISRKEQIGSILMSNGISSLLVETDYVTIGDFKQLKQELNAEILNDSSLTNALIEMRSIKSASELESIKKAQEMTDKTFSYILGKIKPGLTENQVMLDMEFYMRSLGSEGVSFDFIVVSGKNSSLPHGVPTDKVIENGDFVTMDFGAVVNGYRSDMTRTVAIGNVTEKQRNVYNTVLSAQADALKYIKAGVICKNVDKVARDIIYGAGYEGCFGHALGHSVGVEIHESPAFSPRCDTVLKSGTVITVEPGIYIPDTYGVRIEDMVYVTDNGCENLTKSPKELIII